MSERFSRVVVSGVCAFLGAVLLSWIATSRRWGAPVKELPHNEEGGPFTAITMELPAAASWAVISSALVGAMAFGAAGWLLIRHRRGVKLHDLRLRAQRAERLGPRRDAPSNGP